MKSLILSFCIIAVGLFVPGQVEETCAAVTPSIRIDSLSDVTQGEMVTVSVFYEQGDQTSLTNGGFDLLLNYDPAYLTFLYAREGNLISGCEWEAFHYLYGRQGLCGGQPCPIGTIRITAFAEFGMDENRPTCFLNSSGEIVQLYFLVSDDRTLEGTFVPINFIWYSCRDNSTSNIRGDSMFISQSVFDATLNDVTDPGTGYPTLTGAQDSDCFPLRSYTPPVRAIDFYSGGLGIAADLIDIRPLLVGDINLDGIAGDSADFYLFRDYFIDRSSVFDINLDQQTNATDVNQDGINLSVADLIHLARIVENNGNPPPSPFDTSIHKARFIQHFDLKSIEVQTPDTLGAVFMVFRGSILPAQLTYPMELKYRYDAANHLTFVLIYSLNGEALPDGVIMNYQGEAALFRVETAGYTGTRIIFSAIGQATSADEQGERNLPLQFSLHQNYPNPFNPITTISFQLPRSSKYALAIFNLAGQEVVSFKGVASAGNTELSWDATAMATGIYYYRLSAGEFVAARKMLLLK